MTRQIQNSSGVSQFIDDIGVSIPAGIYTIPPERYWYFASSTDIDTLIDTGVFDIICKGVTLSDDDGKALIHEATDYTEIKINGVLFRNQVREVDFVGSFSAVDNGNASISIIANPTVGAGGLYPLSFGSSSSSANYYLSHLMRPLGSDRAPAIVPVQSKIVAMTFTNDDTSVDVNVKVLSAPMGDPNDTATEIIDWELRNVKHAGGCFDITVNALDKIAVFMDDAGKNADDPRVIIWLTPISSICVEDSDDLGADFPNDDDD